MLCDVAFALAAEGYDLHVIASRQSYDAPDRPLPASAVERKVQIYRVWTCLGSGWAHGRIWTAARAG